MSRLSTWWQLQRLAWLSLLLDRQEFSAAFRDGVLLSWMRK